MKLAKKFTWETGQTLACFHKALRSHIPSMRAPIPALPAITPTRAHCHQYLTTSPPSKGWIAIVFGIGKSGGEKAAVVRYGLKIKARTAFLQKAHAAS
jgi:hypothetical protein